RKAGTPDRQDGKTAGSGRLAHGRLVYAIHIEGNDLVAAIDRGEDVSHTSEILDIRGLAFAAGLAVSSIGNDFVLAFRTGRLVHIGVAPWIERHGLAQVGTIP